VQEGQQNNQYNWALTTACQVTTAAPARCAATGEAYPLSAAVLSPVSNMLCGLQHGYCTCRWHPATMP
jgi:hypothetical protein